MERTSKKSDKIKNVFVIVLVLFWVTLIVYELGTNVFSGILKTEIPVYRNPPKSEIVPEEDDEKKDEAWNEFDRP